MLITVPAPETLLQVTWFTLGLVFGRGFGKRLDQDIQASDWFKRRHEVWRNVIRRLLDITHHFWMGLLLVVYSGNQELVWFGWGLVIDDFPDIPARIQGYFNVPEDKRWRIIGK